MHHKRRDAPANWSPGRFFFTRPLVYCALMHGNRKLTALAGAVLVLIWVAGCATLREADDRDDEIAVDPAIVEEDLREPLDLREEIYSSISLALSLGNPEEALETFLQAELADPASADTQVALANLYLAAGELAEADALLRAVLEDEPDHEGALFALALLAGARDDVAEERALLEALLAAHPRHSQGSAALGEVQLRSRQLREAEQSFRTALEEEPDNLVALVGMGNVKLRTDNPDQAEAFLTRAIETAPEYSFAWADRSRARALQLNLQDAEEDIRQAIELEPDFSWHFFDRGRIRLERNDPAGAVEDFTEALALNPGNFMAYVMRGRAHDRRDHHDDAIADFRTALELRPDYLPARAPLAALLFLTERFEEAAVQFDRAYRDIHPNDPRDHGLVFLSSLSRSFSGDPRGGRQYLERMAPELPRTGLMADMARYLANPASDQFIFRQVTREEDRFLRTRMKFYLAAQYELLGRTGSARALYQDIRDEALRGFVETRLAEHRLRVITGQP